MDMKPAVPALEELLARNVNDATHGTRVDLDLRGVRFDRRGFLRFLKGLLLLWNSIRSSMRRISLRLAFLLRRLFGLNDVLRNFETSFIHLVNRFGWKRVSRHLMCFENGPEELFVDFSLRRPAPRSRNFLGDFFDVLILDGIFAPEVGTPAAQCQRTPTTLVFAILRSCVFGYEGAWCCCGGTSPLPRVVRSAEFAREPTFLLCRLFVVKRRIIVVIGNIVQKLACIAVFIHPFCFFLRASTFKSAPDLSASICLFPHVVEAHDSGLFDIADMPSHSMEFTPILGHTFLETLDFFSAEFRLFQVASRAEFRHGFQSLFDVVIVFVQFLNRFGEKIHRRLEHVVLRCKGLDSFHVVIHQLLRALWSRAVVTTPRRQLVRFWHLEQQLSGIFLFALDVNGLVLPSGDVTDRLVDDPFWTFMILIPVCIGASILGAFGAFDMVCIFVFFLDFGRFDQFDRTAVPNIDVGLMTRTKSRTGSRVYPVIVIQGVLNSRMDSEIAPWP
jgi:hypothetical protein